MAEDRMIDTAAVGTAPVPIAHTVKEKWVLQGRLSVLTERTDESKGDVRQ